MALEGLEDVDMEDVAGALQMRDDEEGPIPIKRRRLDSAYSGLGDREDDDDDQVPTASGIRGSAAWQQGCSV